MNKQVDTSPAAVLRRRYKALREEGYNEDFCRFANVAADALNAKDAAIDLLNGEKDALRNQCDLEIESARSLASTALAERDAIDFERSAVLLANKMLIERDATFTARIAALEEALRKVRRMGLFATTRQIIDEVLGDTWEKESQGYRSEEMTTKQCKEMEALTQLRIARNLVETSDRATWDEGRRNTVLANLTERIHALEKAVKETP